MSDKLYTPSNPNAQQGVRNVLKYLSDITYEKIITGQHTQTMAQEELHLIEKVKENSLHFSVLNCFHIHRISTIPIRTMNV